jgi:glycosyltransferase involved in cell wall biosynthesis
MGMRVAVVAEWYPSPSDPVLAVWAHRQALAARAAGADVRVLALRRPIPPLSTARAALRRDLRPLVDWARGMPSTLRAWEHDGLAVDPVAYVSPPRPLSYGSWSHWMALPVARALERLRARWPFDVVHAHNVVPMGDAVARWLRRASGARPAYVVSTHGPDIISVHDLSPVARRATRATFDAADRVIANSRWAQRRCEEIAGRSLPTSVVHLGTDVPDAVPSRRARPTIVTVGHLVARKRHAVVLRALAALRPRLELDYVVIGDGPCRAELERLAGELGLHDHVRFLGQLEPERALAEARSCHMFVMPGVEEPFGVAFIEAMAAGLPAIGARGEGGPEDIAAAGEGMLLVAPDDEVELAGTIEQVLRDGDRLAELGAAARRTVERHFTWERCGEATLQAYRDALQAVPAPASSR